MLDTQHILPESEAIRGSSLVHVLPAIYQPSRRMRLWFIKFFRVKTDRSVPLEKYSFMFKTYYKSPKIPALSTFELLL